MALARHCDSVSCDSWQRLDSRLPQDWLDVTEAQTGAVYAFCSWDCCMRHASTQPAIETLEVT